MRFDIFFALLGASSTLASPLSRRDGPDNTQPVGTNPINNFTVDYLGEQLSGNSCTHRDLGFTGTIAGKWYALYGDTLYCKSGVTDPSKDDATTFNGMVRDSIAAGTSNPLNTNYLQLNNDSPVKHPKQFVPFNASWGEDSSFGFGGTSLCETSAANAQGAVFYLVNANDAGLLGAGVGQVNVLNGVPTVTKRYGVNGSWWNSTTTPRYGDIAAFKDSTSGYIFAWGNPPTSITEYVPSQYVYVARVKASQAFDLGSYQYWWGRSAGWKKDVLTTFNATTSPLWGVGQGQIVWSPYFKVYLFVHMASNSVAIRAAPSPEGPWTADKILYTPTLLSGGLAYAGVAAPWLDSTGKTITISYTNAPNHIQVIKVTFDP